MNWDESKMRGPSIALTVALFGVGAQAHGQTAGTGGAERLETISVTATRTSQGRPLSSIPGSVTVIEREQIERQSAVTDDFGAVLSNLVPGLGPSSQSLTNFGQTLRGRSVLILIDGVPQTTPLRDVSKQLRIIDPNAVERIEVIRGAVATYGYGATGGIINIVTREGEEGEPVYSTEIGVSGSFDDGSDGFGGKLSQSVTGGQGRFDYAVTASAETIGSYFDARGNRIAPDAFRQGGGLADSNEFNLQTKLGFDLTPEQRLQLSGSYYDIEQDTDYITDSDPSNPAYAVPGEPPGDAPGTEDLSLTLDYTHDDVWNGTFSSQLYYQDYSTLFSYYPAYETGGGQSELLSEKLGARVAHERPFGLLSAVYGVDFLMDQTSQSLTDGRTSVPEMEQTSWAPFLQLERPLGDDWLVLGGVRYEHIEVEVPTFANGTVEDSTTLAGGTLDYDETLFNLGVVHFLNDRQELFASFSQGYSVADVGRVLREVSGDENATATTVQAINPAAQVVDNYEIGWRGTFDRLESSVSLFYNTSDLGTTFDNDLNILRQKEEIYGVELTADWSVSDAWTVGGTASWQEGETDTDDDGDVDAYLPLTRISPPKLTAYGEYLATAGWSGRLQLTHFADREHNDYAAVFGAVDSESYTLVDALYTTKVGPGELQAGISNLFDNQYILPLGQVYGAAADPIGYRQAVPGRGRTYSLSYAVQY